MDFDLSDELVAVRDLARDFAEKEIAPTATKDDREHTFRRDLVLKMGELGFYGCIIPEAYGGNGLGFLALTLITEEIARVHSAMRVFINMQAGPALALLQFGAEEQKKRWIPPLISGDTISCFAITEPDAGSDVAAMRATAIRKGASYVLNGTKIWISNAPVADSALIYAYTDRSQKHRGISAFYVDLNQPGLNRRSLETLGAHASPIGELAFENLRVPAENLIGKEGEGFKICMWQLNQTRLNCAAGALGVARAAREAAVSYANQREQFGQKIGRFQMIQDQLARLAGHAAASQVAAEVAFSAADRAMDQGGREGPADPTFEIAVAKVRAGEAAEAAPGIAHQVHGALGFTYEHALHFATRRLWSWRAEYGTENEWAALIGRKSFEAGPDGLWPFVTSR